MAPFTPIFETEESQERVWSQSTAILIRCEQALSYSECSDGAEIWCGGRYLWCDESNDQYLIDQLENEIRLWLHPTYGKTLSAMGYKVLNSTTLFFYRYPIVLK